MELILEPRIRWAGWCNDITSWINIIVCSYRTPILSTKKEKIAKFMCDLISDQENQLLTEADYSASSIINEEISSLQPLSKDKIRAQMLNEWNIVNTKSKDEAASQDNVDTYSETSSYDSAQKDSSFWSACWGNVSDKNISTSTSDEFASLRASPIIEEKISDGEG